jgi:class 3 adenylate cyclase
MDLQDVMVSSPLGVRIGIAAGEPIEEDHDVYGAVVVQASRIADLGDAGEILVSDSVRQLAVGKGFQFELEGEATLKGFDLPEHVWKVTKSTVESPRSSDC